MTIQFRLLQKDLENPTEEETLELAKVINFLDKENIDYDINPPSKKTNQTLEKKG